MIGGYPIFGNAHMQVSLPFTWFSNLVCFNSVPGYDCFPHPPNPQSQGFEEELLERAWAYLEVRMKGLVVNTFLFDKRKCWYAGVNMVVFTEKDMTSGCVQNTRVYHWQVSGDFLESERSLGLWRRWYFWEGTTSQIHPKMNHNALIYIHDIYIYIYLYLYVYIKYTYYICIYTRLQVDIYNNPGDWHLGFVENGIPSFSLGS